MAKKKKTKAVRKSKKRAKPEQPEWLAVEKVVARIQQMMDPGCVVTHNEKIVDRLGNERQFDVVIRGNMGSWNMLGVIECKDHKNRIGPDAVEAFAKKAEHIRANFRMMVSRQGFTEQALTLAMHEGVGTLSLLPREESDARFKVCIPWFGRLYLWEDTMFTYSYDGPFAEDEHETPFCHSEHVANWFFDQIGITYGRVTEPGQYRLALLLDPPQLVRMECGSSV